MTTDVTKKWSGPAGKARLLPYLMQSSPPALGTYGKRECELVRQFPLTHRKNPLSALPTQWISSAHACHCLTPNIQRERSNGMRKFSERSCQSSSQCSVAKASPVSHGMIREYGQLCTPIGPQDGSLEVVGPQRTGTPDGSKLGGTPLDHLDCYPSGHGSTEPPWRLPLGMCPNGCHVKFGYHA